MGLSQLILERIAKLPPATTPRIGVERDLAVPMPDGVQLLADRYFPLDRHDAPVILVRTPYGRRGPLGALPGRVFARRGFQVVVQSCRGTFGSSGRFNAFRDERPDGLATIRWLHAQSWFSGSFAMSGPSYLGIVQWAVASEAGDSLKAIVPQITASQPRSSIFTTRVFSLDMALTWIFQVSHQGENRWTRLRALLRARNVLRRAFLHLPLETADVAATGREVPFFRDWLEHDRPGDPWWEPADFGAGVAEVQVPVHLVGGWYDLFLPDLVADYERLRRAGRSPYLTIGPWAHTSPGFFPVAVRESLAWFRAHLFADRTLLREAPVRLFVMGEGCWRDFPSWPPGLAGRRWHLHPGGRLAEEPPAQRPAQSPDHYRYDPADPTPAVGGSSLSGNSGPRDNRALERRADVLCYTTAPLERALEVIGPVSAELYVGSSLPSADFHVRLCDVSPYGRSVNVCDGIARVASDDTTRPAGAGIECAKVIVSIWPAAYFFKRSHRIRIQVSSGAHPRWARNPGSAEPLGTATRLRAAEQAVFHDQRHPSAIILPARER